MENAIELLWETINFPESALLGKRVPKKQFLESGDLPSRDIKLFQEQVKNVYWQYTLKPSTCSVLPYRDDKREYLEMAVLQIELNSDKGHKKIAEVVHRIIPYPMLLSFYTKGESLALSIAPKRLSQSEEGAFVMEQHYTTDWFSVHYSGEAMGFVDSLQWQSLPLYDYGKLYQGLVDRFIAFECAKLSGTFCLDGQPNRAVDLKKCQELEAEVVGLKKEIKMADFRRKVELNMEIKGLEKELSTLTKMI